MNLSDHLSPQERQTLASLGYTDVDSTDEPTSSPTTAPAAPVTAQDDEYPHHWLPGQHDASEDARADVVPDVSQLRSGALPSNHEDIPDYPTHWI